MGIGVVYGSKIMWGSWPEIQWGAPRLVAVTGSVLSFEEGQQHTLPLGNLTLQGVETLRKKIGLRLTLQGIESAALDVLFQGQAKAGAESMKYAEDDARKNGYGIWGGGSYENDLETLEKLRTRLGDEAIRGAVGPSNE